MRHRPACQRRAARGAEGRRKGRVCLCLNRDPAPTPSAAPQDGASWGRSFTLGRGRAGLGMKGLLCWLGMSWGGCHRACSRHRAPPLPVLGLPGNRGGH